MKMQRNDMKEEIHHDPDLIEPEECRKLLCYKDPSSFRRAVIALDIPRYVLNDRKVLFDRKKLLKWLKAREEGHMPNVY